MRNTVLKLALIVIAATLAGCSSIPGMQGYYSGGGTTTGYANVPPSQQGTIGKSVDTAGNETNVNLTMTGGGEISMRSMDADDKTKMSRALDAGTGKTTHWENGVTGISYTVTPIKKIEINGNPFCRTYSAVASKGNYRKETSGRACVTADGSWHTI